MSRHLKTQEKRMKYRIIFVKYVIKVLNHLHVIEIECEVLEAVSIRKNNWCRMKQQKLRCRIHPWLIVKMFFKVKVDCKVDWYSIPKLNEVSTTFTTLLYLFYSQNLFSFSCHANYLAHVPPEMSSKTYEQHLGGRGLQLGDNKKLSSFATVASASLSLPLFISLPFCPTPSLSISLNPYFQFW